MSRHPYRSADGPRGKGGHERTSKALRDEWGAPRTGEILTRTVLCDPSGPAAALEFLTRGG